MSRRSKSVKRPVPPDPRYDSQTVSKFINNLMYEGQKSISEGIFYRAMDLIEERTGQPGGVGGGSSWMRQRWPARSASLATRWPPTAVRLRMPSCWDNAPLRIC